MTNNFVSYFFKGQKTQPRFPSLKENFFVTNKPTSILSQKNITNKALHKFGRLQNICRIKKIPHKKQTRFLGLVFMLTLPSLLISEINNQHRHKLHQIPSEWPYRLYRCLRLYQQKRCRRHHNPGQSQW